MSAPAVQPKFSIIIPHYQGVISHDLFMRGYKSLEDQTYKNFEILLYHDGPLLDNSVHFPMDVKCTHKRYNDWGHSLRDIGIKEARGEYILHFNPDNILYPNALEKLVELSERLPTHVITLKENGKEKIVPEAGDILIFPIYLMDSVNLGQMLQRLKGSGIKTLLSGFPCRPHCIDCMQFVMRTNIWKKYGGWYDKSEESDGVMYEKFCAKYCARAADEVLGEHW